MCFLINLVTQPHSCGLEFTFPTEGNPIMATRASPDLSTSKPSPFSPFLPVGSSSCPRYLASLAFNVPKWYSVAEMKHNTMMKKLVQTLLLATLFDQVWRYLLIDTVIPNYLEFRITRHMMLWFLNSEMFTVYKFMQSRILVPSQT